MTVAVKRGSIQATRRRVAKSARGITARITVAKRNQKLDCLGTQLGVEIYRHPVGKETPRLAARRRRGWALEVTGEIAGKHKVLVLGGWA